MSYECSECGTTWEDSIDADECCDDEDSDWIDDGGLEDQSE